MFNINIHRCNQLSRPTVVLSTESKQNNFVIQRKKEFTNHVFIKFINIYKIIIPFLNCVIIKTTLTA